MKGETKQMFAINEYYIKSVMNEKGITQGELAQKVNTNEATISLLLRNKQETINLELVYKICQVLGLKINEFIIEKSDPNKKTTEDEVLMELHKSIERAYQVSKLHQKIRSSYNK